MKLDKSNVTLPIATERFDSTHHRPKAVIFAQGAAADAVFYIRTGRVQLTVVSKQGKQAIVAMLGPGEFLGEECLAGQALRSATATTQIASDITKIEKSAMARVLREHSVFADRFTAFLLARTVEIQADLVDQLFNSSERRLARLLLLLANLGTGAKTASVIPKITQEVLAAKVGTTRARINFFMTKFRKLGFIEYNGGLKVHSSLMNIIVKDEFEESHGKAETPAAGIKRSAAARTSLVK